jgi:hypothetical protein
MPGLNEALTIEVLDPPGIGGASHLYKIHGPRRIDESGHDYPVPCCIEFQAGPVKEVGVKGVSIEALLAIAEDRLAGFQSGAYACRDNAVALTKIQEALMWLQRRTRDRVA